MPNTILPVRKLIRIQMVASLTALITCSLILNSQLEAKQDFPEEPKVAAASDEGARAMKSFVYPKNLKIELFAAEPDVANPVAIHVDFQGRVFVCETFRQSKGIEDNRSHSHWLDDDLAAQSVADRIAYIKKHLGDKAVDYTRHDDRIRVIVDSNQDGKSDYAKVFANRFNEMEMGTGAGVLSYRGNVYYTCIPHLWLLKDTDNDLVADKRQSLQTGYGVRFAFRGHDSHGLIVGPDGRLYFSIGDRGYNISTEGKQFKDPASGAVFRCELDGSGFEVVATGLRNPQELAFDEFGNLFTGDNNSDSGDKARWVFVVPGSDSGWRMYYQYLSDRGPFNREKIWHPYSAKESPAYIVPPVTNLADGPSGLAYYPGTGLGDQFRGRFFLCDFRGGPANSGIRTFRVQPKGAFFEVADMEKTFWRQLVTDLHFAPDGSLYVSDWVNGWEGLGKGRIYRYINVQAEKDSAAQQVKKLLCQGMGELDSGSLVQLLGSPDQRVRQESQFELVARNEFRRLKELASDETAETLPRIHAIWGLEMLIRHAEDGFDVNESVQGLLSILSTDDNEVKAQLAKLIGDCGVSSFGQQLINLLDDQDARVRFFAAMSLGKQEWSTGFRPGDAASAIFDLLNENGDADPMIRHGAIMALHGLDSDEIWQKSMNSNSRFVQKAAVVGLRKLADRQRKIRWLGRFLDPRQVSRLDAEVLVEVVRAVHDLPLTELYPAIATLTGNPRLSDSIVHRALNASFRIGHSEQANAIARLAANKSASPAMRLEAVKMLRDWERPSSRDRVLGDWRPLTERAAEPAAKAFRENLASILSGQPELTRTAISTAAKLGIKEMEPTLRKLLADSKNEDTIRADALRALETIKANNLRQVVNGAVNDNQPAVRAAARDLLSRLDSTKALEILELALDQATLREKQAALETLGNMNRQKAVPLVQKILARLSKDELEPEVHLDVLLAARKLDTRSLQKQLKDYQNSKSGDDPLAPFSECKVGGNAKNGERIFFEKAAVYCMRCHKVNGRGGEVGPELTKIGKEKDRRYLLEAIVNPDAAIAENFETVLVATDDGLTYSGIVKSESDEELVLVNSEGKTIRIEKDAIEQIGKGKSSMPADLVKNLSLSEIRDLVEFLSSLN